MKYLRILIRKILSAREYESIEDALLRKKIEIEKHFYKKKFSKEELRRSLNDIGVVEGTQLIVHASWRQFYNFKGSPDDVIDILKEAIGESGTLLMPAYGHDKFLFDVKNTPSAAGVISEVFREKPDTYRSPCTNFSVAASGKYAKELTEQHINSVYGFDKYSPYYLLSEYNNSKVLFLGLSSRPTKISLFHCAGYILKDKIPFYENIYTEKIKTELIYEGLHYNKNMITRNPMYMNDNKVFKEIFRNIKNKNSLKISNLDIVMIDLNEGLEKALDFAHKGKYCYKMNRRIGIK